MSEGTLALSLGSFSVVIDQFENDDLPREMQSSELRYSAFGTPASSGFNYLFKHTWNVSCIVDPTQRRSLMRIFSEQERLRRLRQPHDILIYDYTEFVYENVQVRAIAPGASLNSDGSGVWYYARFKGKITQSPRQRKVGSYKEDGVWHENRLLSFVIQETVVVES